MAYVGFGLTEQSGGGGGEGWDPAAGVTFVAY